MLAHANFPLVVSSRIHETLRPPDRRHRPRGADPESVMVPPELNPKCQAVRVWISAAVDGEATETERAACAPTSPSAPPAASGRRSPSRSSCACAPQSPRDRSRQLVLPPLPARPRRARRGSRTHLRRRGPRGRGDRRGCLRRYARLGNARAAADASGTGDVVAITDAPVLAVRRSRASTRPQARWSSALIAFVTGRIASVRGARRLQLPCTVA